MPRPPEYYGLTLDETGEESLAREDPGDTILFRLDDGVGIDEDTGDENEANIFHLPSSLLRSQVELQNRPSVFGENAKLKGLEEKSKDVVVPGADRLCRDMKVTLPTNGVAKELGQSTKIQTVVQWCSEKWRAVLGELISTTLLLLFGCMACVPTDGVHPPPGYAPLTFGFAVLFNITAFGHISGAHMNPAVSVAAVIWGSLSPLLAIFYIIAQCCGAILGFGLLTWFTPLPLDEDAICSTLPGMGLTDGHALVVEIALTAALMLLNCAVWDPVNKHLQDGVPIKFGLVITGLSFAGAHFTGASMNPARSLGPALWNGSWRSHWVYWAGPMISGIFITLLYKHVLVKRKSEN